MIKIWTFGKKEKYGEYTFDSSKELNFYKNFCEKYDNNLNDKYVVLVHPSFSIIDKFELEPGLNVRGAKYTPDFVITDYLGNFLHVYDVKNDFSNYAVDAAAKLRFKLFEKRYGVPVECVVTRKDDFKVKVFGMTKNAKIHVFKDFDYDWREVLC